MSFKEVVSQDSLHYDQEARHSEATAAVVQGATTIAQASSRTWHCPADAGFPDMQNIRVVGSWRLLCSFQRKAWKCPSERRMHKSIGIKAKVQWRIQEVRDARNVQECAVECLQERM